MYNLFCQGNTTGRTTNITDKSFVNKFHSLPFTPLRHILKSPETTFAALVWEYIRVRVGRTLVH